MPFFHIRIDCPPEAFEVLDYVIRKTHHFHIRLKNPPTTNYLIFIREADCKMVRDFAKANHYPFESMTEQVMKGESFQPGSYTHQGDVELAGWL